MLIRVSLFDKEEILTHIVSYTRRRGSLLFLKPKSHDASKQISALGTTFFRFGLTKVTEDDGRAGPFCMRGIMNSWNQSCSILVKGYLKSLQKVYVSIPNDTNYAPESF